MSDNHQVKIFTMPQEFPCGPSSACCGPIGQSEEELKALAEGLEKALNIKVATFNVKDGKVMREHRQILALLRSFGWGVLPIIAVDDEVVAMGPPTVQEAVELVKNTLETVAK